MIEFDFGPDGGGLQSFKEFDELPKYAEARAREWSSCELLKEPLRQRRDWAAQSLRGLPERWSAVQTDYLNFVNRYGGNQQGAFDQIKASFVTHPAIALNSGTGALIVEILREDGVSAAGGAAAFMLGPDATTVWNEMPKGASKGALTIWARSNGFDTRAAAAARNSQRRTLRQLEERVAEHRSEFERAEALLAARLTDSANTMEMQRAEFQSLCTSSKAAIDADRGVWQAEWEEKRELYVEQLKLRAAVAQWADRAVSHEGHFVSQRRWVAGIGIVGLGGALFWSWGALALAHWLFGDALVAGVAKPAVGTLRPTWIHELIFAASASLLYLTLFLWTMRLLVRMMMSEHHLGIDARSRESMAHTYLALIETGAASDADRSIVLSALFRPVTDGLVKDDALPLISPASFLSGLTAK